jgi:DMSO/TMAO reductase YedYZ molybdopterin-dependent catalytic subunit
MTNRLYGSRWHGAAIGVLSTVSGLALAHLVAGLNRNAASPVTAVGGEFIDIVPMWLKDLAIDWFGTNDKIALKAGIYSVLLLVGAVIGIMVVRDNRAGAYSATVLIGFIGAWAVLMRPDPTMVELLPTIVGTGVSLAVLWWLAPSRHHVVTAARSEGDNHSVGDDSVRDESGVDGFATAGSVHDAAVMGVPLERRSFLASAGAIAGVSLLAAGLGERLGRRFDVGDEIASLTLPEPADTLPPATDATLPGASRPGAGAASGAVPGPTDFGIEGVEAFQVPTNDFYRIDTALSVPQVPRESWSLRVHGMVDNELEISFADLIARPTIERYITLSCVSNEVGGGLVGNALFQGVLMSDLLNEAGIQEGATQVVSRSIDGWNCGSPTSAIMDGRDAMLAFGMNGEPLPAEHGYPVRLVVPGLYGYVSATKWVTDIELTTWEAFDGYWVPRGWSKEGPVKTMARIDRPTRRGGITANGEGIVDIAGLAWAVHRGISRVEVQIDDGAWLECELAGVPSDDTWRQWRYRWADAPLGDHQVKARAYDGAGEPQPVGPKSVAPDGAEGYHAVRFTVT